SCWIAPRDVRPGKPFDDEIADAIEAADAMVLVFSARCNESEYIRREVTVAGDSGKVIIPFRIEDAQPRRGLRVRLADLHWIDAFAEWDRAINELVRSFPSVQAGQAIAPSKPNDQLGTISRQPAQAAQSLGVGSDNKGAPPIVSLPSEPIAGADRA